MSELALAVAFLGCLAYAGYLRWLKERRTLREEAKVEHVEVDDFVALQRNVITLRHDVDELKLARAFTRGA